MDGDFHSASSATGSSATVEDSQQSQSDNRSSMSPPRTSDTRRWRDVFWLVVFSLHLLALGFALALLGINRFKEPDRLKIDRYTSMGSENQVGLTETYWPMYGVAGAVGMVLGWIWLLLLGYCANQLLKVSVHFLTTYLSVISVLCFWGKQFFWGIAFAVGATLQFLYVMAVLQRLSFTMLVLQKAVRMVWNLPEVMRVAYAFMFVMLAWMAFWSFGVAGVVASSIGDGGRWWLLVVSWCCQLAYFGQGLYFVIQYML